MLLVSSLSLLGISLLLYNNGYIFPRTPERISFRNFEPKRYPDTTAVVLNWSRLPNVIRIVELLCSDALSGTIASVYVWNNSPNPVTKSQFSCPEDRLRIHNSPSNLYFHARFLACAESSTPYCFIQDDDYLVLPEIIHALQTSISPHENVYLLPPHEFMNAQLRTTDVGAVVHSGFAWLGHGALVHRSHVAAFLELLECIKASQEELKMADNYFSILRNTHPDVWLDQSIELGGGQPFTVGTQGDLRNLEHINRATAYLDMLLQCSGSQRPCKSPIPYLLQDLTPSPRVTRTACVGTPCILGTTISLVPEFPCIAMSAHDMLLQESTRRKRLNESQERRFLLFPLSNLVDRKEDTAFCTEQVHKGDVISLDLLRNTSPYWRGIEIVFLLETHLLGHLDNVSFQVSLDGQWTSSPHRVLCKKTLLLGITGSALEECSVKMLAESAGGASLFQMVFTRDISEEFCMNELWISGQKYG